MRVSGEDDGRVTAASLPPDLGPDDRVLLGWPVAHSRSPAMHAAAAAHLGLALRYRALAVHPDEVVDVIAELGRRGVRGANVTVPHKRVALDAADHLTEEARLVGAVNTLTWEHDASGVRLEGHNTDAVGLERALAEDVGSLQGARALLVGTGVRRGLLPWRSSVRVRAWSSPAGTRAGAQPSSMSSPPSTRSVAARAASWTCSMRSRCPPPCPARPSC